jgi:hypothetical protein
MEIKHSYLMWVGNEHYKTVDEYVKEALELGVSKRLPSVHFAEHLATEGAVVFLAHDEGEREPCAKCVKTTVCTECEGVGLINVPGEVPHTEKCTACDGGGTITKGTGGSVVVDKESWTWTKYMWHKKQPKLFNPIEHIITDEVMCTACGGFGSLPKGFIFGMFMPDRVEYIFKDGEPERAAKAAEKGMEVVHTIHLAGESKRKCGVRKPGGYYITTTKDETGIPTEDMKAKVEDLKAKGLVEGASIHGSFATFVNKVSISCKRFRGMKRFSMDPVAEDEATMIMEAMA